MNLVKNILKYNGNLIKDVKMGNLINVMHNFNLIFGDKIECINSIYDLPIIYTNCNQYWYRHKLIHRNDDKPALILYTGSKSWYQYGELHRDKLPAVKNYNGYEYMYHYGHLIKYQNCDFDL